MMRAAALAVAALTLVPAVASGTGGSRPLKVALVTDIPPRASTHDFRGLEYLGFLRAVKELDVEGRVVQTNPKNGAGAALALLGRQKYDLVYTGLASIDEVEAAAERFPETRFLFPGPYALLKSKPPNVQGEDFRIEQAGYLAGYLAGLMERRRPGRDVIGSVAGLSLPPIDDWIVGFERGARSADPGVTILRRYSQDFQDPAKCRAVADAEIARGASVLFQVAGLCGRGTLAAAKENGLWGVGVDGDESYLGPHVLTSAIARYDVAVYRAIEALVQGNFETRGDYRYDLANGGVGLGRISPDVPQSVLRGLAAVRAQIVAGAIRVPRSK